MEPAWANSERCKTSITVGTTGRWTKKVAKEHLEERDGKSRQRTSSTAGGKWRWQHKRELDGQEWSVTYVPLGPTRHKSSYGCSAK